MALFKMHVEYLDGREVDVVVSPKALVMTEDYFNGTDSASDHKIKAHYYTAWAALNSAGKEPAAFDEFMDLVASAVDVYPTDEEEKASDPTQPAPTTTGSSD